MGEVTLALLHKHFAEYVDDVCARLDRHIAALRAREARRPEPDGASACATRSVHPLPERRILRLARRRDTRVVICLVGVQTSQFPRAADLARRFARRGIAVLIGGFHVSGALAFTEVGPAHLRALGDEGSPW